MSKKLIISQPLIINQPEEFFILISTLQSYTLNFEELSEFIGIYMLDANRSPNSEYDEIPF